MVAISLKLASQNSLLHGYGAVHNISCGSSTRLKQKKKCWKVHKGKPNYVLGCDIAMDRVKGLSEKVRVGKLFYSRMNKTKLYECLFGCWKPILGYFHWFSH
jgi:hypothetical protein